MKKFTFYVGVDIADKTFFASCIQDLTSPKSSKEFESTPEGYKHFVKWLNQFNATSENSLVCMEATGSYGDRLAYFLANDGFSLVIEAPHKVKRAFTKLDKTDRVDAEQIAEYAMRFEDQLSQWKPREELVEQVQILLSTREQLTEQRTASKNSLTSIMRKHFKSTVAEKALKENIKHLEVQIKKIDKQIKKDIDSDQILKQTFILVTSIPSVGNLLFNNLFVITNGFQTVPNPKQLSAYAGIAPFKHESGTSVYKKPRSQRGGPSKLRKVLYLASMCLRTHHKGFKYYFERKVNEGKNPRLVLNNIANKLIKIICAVLKNKKPYIPTYISVHPDVVK